MIRKCEALHIQETKHDADDVWWQWHLCYWCEAWETGRPEAEVLNTALRKPIERKLLRAKRYTEVLNAHTEEWSVLTKSGQRRFLRSKLEVLFEPLGKFLELKRRALHLVAKDVMAHNDLLRMLWQSSSLQEEELIYKAMMVLEKDNKYIAYKSKGKAQHAWIRVCSYNDEWVNTPAGSVKSYFICMGKTRSENNKASKCRRIIPSKKWDKRKDDTVEEWVSKQRWYCTCSTRYKSTWGQVVIIEESDGTKSYVRAECPPWDLEDVRAMKTEATVSAADTKKLYEKIHAIQPRADEIVGIDSSGSMYIKKLEDFQAMPFFSWNEVLTLTTALNSRM